MVNADDFFVFSPCRTEGSYQAVLRKPTELDLKKLAGRLRAKGLNAIFSDDYLLVVFDEQHFSVFPNGKILSKGAPTVDTFKKLALLVYDLATRE